MSESPKVSLRDLQADLEKIELELEGIEGEAADEARERVEQLRGRSIAAHEKQAGLQRRLEALRRSSRRDRPAYEAMTVEIPKWRTVILLGVNSAAIAAVLSNDKLLAPTIQASSVLFLAGALTALASGSTLDRVGRNGLELADELERADLDEEPAPDHGLTRAEEASARLTKARRRAEVLRSVSIALFAAGVVFAAFQLHFYA